MNPILRQSPITNHLILFFFLSFLLPIPLISQYYVNRAWVQIDSQADTLYFSLSGQDPIEWSTSTLDNGGNLITVGNVLQGPGDADILVTKYSPGGVLSWQGSYDGPAGGLDFGLTLITDNQGAVYVAGVVTDTTGFYDMMLLKYSSAGALQWSRRWGGAAGLHDAPTALYLDSGGNLIVAGVTYSVANLTDWVIMKLNSSGSPQWIKTYDYNNLYEIPVRIEEDSTGQIVVSGFSQSGFTSWDMAQIPFAASDGSLGTESRQGISGIDLDRPVRVAHNEASELFIAGNAPGGGEKTLNIIKLDAEFEIAWTASHAQSGYDLSVRSVGVDEENRVFVAATAAPSSGPKHALLLSFNEEGELRWQRPWRSLAPGGSAEARAMRVAPSGNVAMACVTDTETTGLDFATLIFDAEGVLRVSKQLNSANDHDDSPTDLSFVDEEAVYVTGTAKGGGLVKYLTAKYELMKQGTEAVVIDSVPVWMANELIVKFKPELVNTDFVDNLHRQFADLDAVIPDSVIWDLESRMDVELERVKAVKIYNCLTTGHTHSITRLGDTIPIPPFWSSLLLIFPAFMEIDSLVGGFNLADEWVEYAEYNYLGELFTVPNDTLFNANLQLSLHAFEGAEYTDAHINILDAWEEETGKDIIKVGVYDKAVYWLHEEFIGSGWPPNYIPNVIAGGRHYFHGISSIFESAPDSTSHGTAVPGIIGARRNNQIGIAGIAGGTSLANSGVKIYSMAIVSNSFLPSFVPMAVAYDAIFEGALDAPGQTPPGWGLHVHNHSWGITGPSEELRNGIRFAFQNQVITVASRGNDGLDINNPLKYPACFDDEWVISVGASGYDGKYFDGSNGEEYSFNEPLLQWASSYGDSMDIIAPGVVELVTTTVEHNELMGRYNLAAEFCPVFTNNFGPDPIPPHKYSCFSGTSAAAPHVSGVAALMLSKHHTIEVQPNNLAPEDAEFIIQRYATNVDTSFFPPNYYDELNAWGRLNAGGAVDHVSLPCWTVWHSGEPYSTASIDVDSSVGTDLLSTRYEITHTYHRIFGGDTIIADAWPRLSSTKGAHGIYPTLPATSITSNHPIRDPYADYEILFNGNEISVTAVTYTWYFPQYGDGSWVPTTLDAVKTAFSVHLDNCGITSNQEAAQTERGFVRLYPNPANENINLNWEMPDVQSIEVYSPHGRLLRRFTGLTGARSFNLDISAYPAGVYFIRLINSDSASGHIFIKQ